MRNNNNPVLTGIATLSLLLAPLVLSNYDAKRPQKEVSRVPIETGSKLLHVVTTSTPWGIGNAVELHDGTNVLGRTDYGFNDKQVKIGEYTLRSDNFKTGPYEIHKKVGNVLIQQ